MDLGGQLTVSATLPKIVKSNLWTLLHCNSLLGSRKSVIDLNFFAFLTTVTLLQQHTVTTDCMPLSMAIDQKGIIIKNNGLSPPYTVTNK